MGMSQSSHQSGEYAHDDTSQTPVPEVDAELRANPSASALIDDLEAILDQIDDVLEENAEEFVRNYVQKGGE